MQQMIGTLVAAVLGGLGYLVQRWLRPDAVAETINRRLKLVTLYQKMRTAGLDDAELERLERRLMNGGATSAQDGPD